MWMFYAFVSLSLFLVVFALFYPYFMEDNKALERVRNLQNPEKNQNFSGMGARLLAYTKDTRRKQIQDSLKAAEAVLQDNKPARKDVKSRLVQSGLSITIVQYWVFAFFLGVFLAGLTFFVTGQWLVTGGAFFAGVFGVPIWLINLLCKRRRNKFLHIFPDAIDVMVRGIKAGLPVSEAMRLIAAEIPDPVGSEFLEVVEGQRVGITIDQGFDRMYDRVPVPEVNFLSIVMAVQAKTGGNLAEALNNLSKILRDRRKMKLKIKALSQEAKASAMIIGALPFAIIAMLHLTSPGYLTPLFTTSVGHLLLAFCLIWMSLGIYVMRQLINFDF